MNAEALSFEPAAGLAVRKGADTVEPLEPVARLGRRGEWVDLLRQVLAAVFSQKSCEPGGDAMANSERFRAGRLTQL
jgi:hypothetical protein